MISIGNLQINKLCLGDVEVTKAYLGDVQVYGSKQQPEGKYMTITVSDGASGTVISPTVTGTLSPNLQYRINRNGDWNDFIVGTTADIHLVSGDWVQFKGNNTSGLSNSQNDYLNFAISGNPVSLSGNVMSLIDGVGDALVIPNNYCFYRLFHSSSIKTVSPDFLPATTLTNGCYFDLFSNSILENAPELPALIMKDNCYRGMFYGCQNLTQAPSLPATTLSNYCYAFMLSNCSSLVQVTALPATELATECYRGIFQGCTALVTAPALPATELANYCYKQMFYGCTALTQAPELPATTLAEGCYQFMFYGDSSLNYVKCLAVNGFNNYGVISSWLSGVSSSGTFVKPSGVTYPSGTSGIPSGWTVEEYVPKYMTMTIDGSAGSTTISPKVTGSLPNLNLQYRINNGNWNDFIVGTTADIIVGAGDVVQWKGLNKDGLSIDTKNYLNFSISNPVHMSGNVMSLIDGKGDELVIPNNYCFYKLFSTSKLNTVSSDFLPATGLTSYCYQFMFERCSNLTQSPELPATTLAPYCYNRMFLGCSSLNQSPALPATTLAQNCYENMFENCESLTQAPELHSTNLAHSCYSFMFNGCSSLVQAPALPATTIAPYCYYYMFGGCSKLTQAPVLNATTLKTYCYAYMFNGCSKLNYVKSLATNITATNALNQWLSGVASTGTFVKPAGVEYVLNSNSGIPSGWTIQNI